MPAQVRLQRAAVHARFYAMGEPYEALFSTRRLPLDFGAADVKQKKGASSALRAGVCLLRLCSPPP